MGFYRDVMGFFKILYGFNGICTIYPLNSGHHLPVMDWSNPVMVEGIGISCGFSLQPSLRL